MNDNALFKLIFSILQSGLTSIGQGAIQTQQNYQPTAEGVNSAPTIFIYKIGPDENMGFPARQSVQGEGMASFTGSITGNILNVTNLASGLIQINQVLAGSNLPNNLVITEILSGTGGEGTYLLNYTPVAVSSKAMTSSGAQVYTETQQKISLFQASALAAQNPANTESLTASDILNYACYVLQSGAAIAAFEAQGVGMLRIPEVRNPYFSDDRVRWESSPNMDFSLTHKQIVSTVIPVVLSDELQVLPV